MSLRLPCSIAAAAATMLCALSANAQVNPFAPGGPLEPWKGPVPQLTPPRPHFALRRNPVEPPPAASEPSHQSRAFPSYAPAVDADRVPREKQESRSYVALLLNPILAPLGKNSARMEVAPLSAHALYIEGSKISINVPEIDRTVSGWAVDFGYHFFPMGDGLNGFYIGPRYSTGKGDTSDATGQYSGWGGDLGYQFVIANHLVFNLGIGAIYIKGSAQAKDSAIAAYIPSGVDPAAYGIDTQQTVSRQLLLPVATLGVGLAL